jgi:hypothetical protein
MMELLASLLESPAVAKMQRRRELTFADAAQFWGITAADRGNAVDSLIADVNDGLHAAQLAVGDGSIVLDNGRTVSAKEIAELIELHKFLLHAFDRHLSLFRTRA